MKSKLYGEKLLVLLNYIQLIAFLFGFYLFYSWLK